MSLAYRYALSRSNLAHWLHQQGASPHHVKPLLGSVYRQPRDSESSQPLISTVGAKLYRQFQQSFQAISSRIKREHVCRDDLSVKLEIALADGHTIETMIIPETSRITICISSQVGCAQGCVFCATAQMKLVRQLAVHEIIEQVILAAQWIAQQSAWQQSMVRQVGHGVSLAREPHKITNVVFMGMGEPGDNHEAVITAAQILIDPWCCGLAPRKVTLSTAGHLGGLKRIYQAIPQISYAVSIHSAQSHRRSALMPINRRFPLKELLAFLQNCSVRDGKTFFIQYMVIKGVNDTQADAQILAQSLQGIKCKVNLLTYNPTVFMPWRAAEATCMNSFAQVLRSCNYPVSIRISKGQQIHGACGQLIQQPR